MREIPLETMNKIRASAEALSAYWPDALDPEHEDLVWVVHVMYEADGGSSGLTTYVAANRDGGSVVHGMTFAQYHVLVLDRAQAVRGVAEARAQACAERDWTALQAAKGVRGYVVPLPVPQGRGGRGRGRRPAKRG